MYPGLVTGVRLMRDVRGTSQGTLARLARIRQVELSKIELGRIKPSVAVAIRLAAALGLAVEHLFPELRMEKESS